MDVVVLEVEHLSGGTGLPREVQRDQVGCILFLQELFILLSDLFVYCVLLVLLYLLFQHLFRLPLYLLVIEVASLSMQCNLFLLFRLLSQLNLGFLSGLEYKSCLGVFVVLAQ